MFFSAAIAACALLTGVSAAPGGLETLGDRLNSRQSSTPNGEGTNNGYFYSWWSDGASPATYTNGDGGSYSVTWQSGGNLVGGKGWNPGTGREISYTADWKPENNGNSYLTIYGWTRSPLVEYYVLEAHGEYNPGSSGQSRGSVQIGGDTYQLYEATRVNAPSIDGTQTFQQYWAIRDSQRTSGTVNMQEVFDAWQAAGMSLGSHYYQIVATEAYNSKGTSSVQVQTPA
jgi:endo-1,4-beta-xylanase